MATMNPASGRCRIARASTPTSCDTRTASHGHAVRRYGLARSAIGRRHNGTSRRAGEARWRSCDVSRRRGVRHERFEVAANRSGRRHDDKRDTEEKVDVVVRGSVSSGRLRGRPVPPRRSRFGFDPRRCGRSRGPDGWTMVASERAGGATSGAARLMLVVSSSGASPTDATITTCPRTCARSRSTSSPRCRASLKTWVSDEASERWARRLWWVAFRRRSRSSSRAREPTGKDTDVIEIFDLEATVSVSDQCALGLAFSQ